GHAGQLALGVESPAMIRADETLVVAATLFRQLHAAMAAGVEEAANDAILAAYDDDRLAGDVGGEIVARVRHIGRERDKLRTLEEHHLLLELEPVLVDEAADIGLPGLVAHIGLTGFDQAEDFLGNGDTFGLFHR